MWFKVDDKLHSHKKAARAGVGAMGLWAVAGSWCADHLTDGFVPDYIAHRLAPGEADEFAARLVKAGLWVVDECDGDEGWRFRDWAEYQPTRDDVEAAREREREKKRSQRRNRSGQFEASPGESPNVSPGDTAGTAEGSPAGVTPSRPDPTRPDPKQPSRPDPEVSDDARSLTRLLAQRVKSNGFKIPRPGQKAHREWLVEADRLIRLDKADPEEARRVAEWATSDEFWRSNIQSMPKFREKYPQLRLKCSDEQKATRRLRSVGNGGVAG